ncbi:MAG: hypothetical protein JEZ07_19565 [Phycisphaerae bacterium]|nr:hypothetical protein [Phycisphaerae bacterium]
MMTTIINPIAMFFSLIVTVINITEFFLLVHLILLWKDINWLKSFNTAGAALVKRVMNLTEKSFSKLINKTLSIQGSIIAALAILQIMKVMLYAICKL